MALRSAARAYRSSASPAERSQARWVSIGIFVPLFVGSLTDGLLPLAGIQLPRLATASFVVPAAIVLWTVRRYGYSLLAPGDFASEILGALPDGVALLRLDGSVRGANAAMLHLLGCGAQELLGVSMGERLGEPLDLSGDGLRATLRAQDLRGARASRWPSRRACSATAAARRSVSSSCCATSRRS